MFVCDGFVMRNVYLIAIGKKLVPPHAEWWCKTDNWTMAPLGHYPSMASVPVWYIARLLEGNRCKGGLNIFPPGELGDHQDALTPRGWRLSSRTSNHLTYPWMKQSTWLRITHSGDWYLMLRIRSGACQKWMNEYLNLAVMYSVMGS